MLLFGEPGLVLAPPAPRVSDARAACPLAPCTVGAVTSPKKPFAAIVGGSKVSSKIGVIEALLGQCDKLVLG